MLGDKVYINGILKVYIRQWHLKSFFSFLTEQQQQQQQNPE